MNGRRLAVLALAVAFSVVWSSAFIAGKVALARLDPASLLSLRFALSALLLSPFAFRGGGGAFRLGLGLGALNNAVYLGLTFWALALTRPVVVVAIVSCAPFMTAGLAAAFGIDVAGRRDPQRPRQRRGQIGQNVGVQIGCDDSIDRLGFAHHPHGHRIH